VAGEVELPKSPLGNLVAKSRRLEQACCKHPLVVGVFQNQSKEFIEKMVRQCGIDVVQLHGKEGMEAANPLKCGGVPAIRVVDVECNADGSGSAPGAAEKILEALTTDPTAILLDTSVRGKQKRGSGGGTGVTFDWSIAETVQAAGLPVIVAGGLNPGNVGEAVKNVKMWGVDVSSGVEETPGKKDDAKVEHYVRKARAAAVDIPKRY